MATNPFTVEQKTYVQFPTDLYVDACILSYQQADLPPGPLADTNDPVKSCRFLFGGFVKDEAGNLKCDETGAPIVVRKWTNWMRISNDKKAKLMQTFNTTKNGFANLFDILQDCESSEGKLWMTPMQILLEQDDKYQTIKRIKPGNNVELCKQVFYDDKYVPYKVVKAYGKPVPLSLAGCKFASGVKTFDPDTMADAPEE